MAIKTKYILEKVWHHKGLRCVVLMTEGAHRCGYVGVDSTHPFYGKDYSWELVLSEENKKSWGEQEYDIDKLGVINLLCYDPEKEGVPLTLILKAHGGLTYSNGGKKTAYPIHSDLWWFGYDCAHLGDAKDMRLLKILNKSVWDIEMEYMMGSYTDILRSQEYCVSECESLAYQLSEFLTLNEV